MTKPQLSFSPYSILVALISLTLGSHAWADHSQYRGNAARSAGLEQTVDLSDSSKLTELYSTTLTASNIFAEPLIVDQLLIVVSEGGDVICVDIDSGTPVWSQKLSSGILATPAVDKGRLFVGTTGGKVVAFQLSDGEILWEVSHGGYQLGAPVVINDKVIVSPGFGSDYLFAYDQRDGSIVWQAPVSRDVQGSPAVYDDKVIVALPNGEIDCYLLSDGSKAWAAPVQTQGIFYAISPMIVHDSDSGEIYVYVAPGGDVERNSSNLSLTGFKGYMTYRIKLDDGSYDRLIPSRDASYAASSRSARANGKTSSEVEPEADPLRDIPHDLQAELNKLTDLNSMLSVIEGYEQEYGLDLSELKAALKERSDNASSYLKAQEKAEGAGKRSSASSRASLPGSSFDANWPSGNSVRPAPAAYLERGNSRFLAIMMREIPSISIKARTLLFSVNASTFGELYWHYSSDSLDTPATINSQGALLVPNQNDPHGAYMIAPLGRNIAIFDAASGNTPIFEIEMPGIVYQTPAIANGYFAITDTSGHLKVFSTNNSAPQAPVITSPNQDQDILLPASVKASWNAAIDDSAPVDIRYQFRYVFNGDLETEYTEIELPAGTTEYIWPTTPAADTTVSFQVRGIDENGAVGFFSPARSFTFQKDIIPPAAISNLVTSSGPLEIQGTFDPSPDEAPQGSADVAGYRINVIEQGTNNSFSLEIGLTHSFTLNGSDPNTPMDANHQYEIHVVAYDGRNNESPALTVYAQPDPANDTVDTLAPFILSAHLLDLDTNGAIETVELVFSEPLDSTLGNFDFQGFALDGIAPSNAIGPVNETLTLKFGNGVSGTDLKELTFDASTGLVRDLSGNLLKTLGNNGLSEIDAANPTFLPHTLEAHDDTGNGKPDRITVDFSEVVDASSLDLDDLALLQDSQGASLNALDMRLLANSITLEIELDGQKGVLGKPLLDFIDDGDGTFFSDVVGNTLVNNLSNQPPSIRLSLHPGAHMAPGLLSLSTTGSSDPDGDDTQLVYDWSVDLFASSQAPVFYPSGQNSLSTSEQDVQLILVEPGTYGFRLQVRDEQGAITEETIQVVVANEAPVAHAGPDRFSEQAQGLIPLIGENSADANSSLNYNDIQSYLWSIVEAPSGAFNILSQTTSARAFFDTSGAPVGTYRINLEVRDYSGVSSTDELFVHIFDGTLNIPPTAYAGPDRSLPLQAGQASLILQGGFSYDDQKTTLSYQWDLIEGDSTKVQMHDTFSATTNLSIQAPGSYQFRLRVNDGSYESDDFVWVEVFDPQGDYIPSGEVIVPDSASIGEVFEIDMSSCVDIDGSPVLVELEQNAGPRLIQVEGAQTAKRKYLAYSSGIVELLVRINDGEHRSAPQSLQIAIQSGSNSAPELQIDLPNTLEIAQDLHFDLQGSNDSEADPISFDFYQLAGPAASYAKVAGQNITFKGFLPGNYAFELRGSDGFSPALPLRVSFTLESASAHLPEASITTSTQSLDLAASNSFALFAEQIVDLDGDIVSFLWVQNAGPQAQILDPTASSTGVELPPVEGVYVFELFINDGTFQTSAGTTSLSVFNSAALKGDVSAQEESSGCSLIGGTYGGIGFSLIILGIIGAVIGIYMSLIQRKKLPKQSV